MSHRVLIIDDEAGIRQALKQVLEYEDLEVRVAASGGEAITIYSEFRPALVFLDVKMAGIDGLEALKKTPGASTRRDRRHDQRSRDDPDRGRGHPARRVRHPREAARHRPAARHAAQCARAPRSRATRTRGSAQTIAAAIEIVGRVVRHSRGASTRSPRWGRPPARVLITGENGTGKELVARATAPGTRRARDGPFVEVNCAAIPTRADRERAVRAREGLVHRRRRRPARASSSRPTAARSSSTRSAT